MRLTIIAFITCLMHLNASLAQGRPGSSEELNKLVDDVVKKNQERIDQRNKKRREWFSKKALSGHHFKLLLTGKDLVAERIKMINEAKEFIYIATFDYADGPFTTKITEALCNASLRGVDVRMMTYSLFARNFVKEFGDRFINKCRMQFVEFFPRQGNLGHALHEKLLIVDGRSFIIGGSNYSPYNHLHRPFPVKGVDLDPWIDLDISVYGPLACHFTSKFLDQWRNTIMTSSYIKKNLIRGRQAKKKCYLKRFKANKKAVYAYGTPYYNDETPTFDLQVKAILMASTLKKKEIRIYAPYFIPGRNFSKAVVWALKQGVKVTFITNSSISNDNKAFSSIMNVSMVRETAEMRKHGAKVYLWNGLGTMHRKAAMIGDEYVLMGSDNFDVRGQHFSSEAVILFEDKKINKFLTTLFDVDQMRTTDLLTEEKAEKILEESNLGIDIVSTVFRSWF